MNEGGVVSTTVTANEHWALLPLPSVAVQTLVVEPSGKVAPLALAQWVATGSQTSLALTLKVAVAPLDAAHSIVIEAGQVIWGGVVSAGC